LYVRVVELIGFFRKPLKFFNRPARQRE
jgi:hypothetical protein